MTTDTNAAAPAGDRRPHVGRAPVGRVADRPPEWPPFRPLFPGRPVTIGRAPLRRPVEGTPPAGTPTYNPPQANGYRDGIAAAPAWTPRTPPQAERPLPPPWRHATPERHATAERHVTSERHGTGDRRAAIDRGESADRHSPPSARQACATGWPGVPLPATAAAGPPAATGPTPPGGPVIPTSPPAHFGATPVLGQPTVPPVPDPPRRRPPDRSGSTPPLGLPQLTPPGGHRTVTPPGGYPAMTPPTGSPVTAPPLRRVDGRQWSGQQPGTQPSRTQPSRSAHPGALVAAPASRPSPPPRAPHPGAGTATYLGDAYRQHRPPAPDLTATTVTIPTTDTAESTGLRGLVRALRDDDSARPSTSKRLVAACVWAALLGLAGLVLAAWSGMEVLVGAPSWFLPAAGAVGLAGIASTVAALSISRRALTPWFLLGLATCALGAAVYLIEIVDAARAVAFR